MKFCLNLAIDVQSFLPDLADAKGKVADVCA